MAVTQIQNEQAQTQTKTDAQINCGVYEYLRTHETETAMKLIDYAWNNEPEWIEFFRRRPDVLYSIRIFIERVQYCYDVNMMVANKKYSSYFDAFKEISAQGKAKIKPYRECFIDEYGNDFYGAGVSNDGNSEREVRKIFWDAIPQWEKDMHNQYPDKFPLIDEELFDESSSKGTKDNENPDKEKSA